MSLEATHQTAIIQLLNEAIADTDLFLIESRFLPNSKIELFLDADSAVTIQQCTKIARHIIKNIDEKYGEDFNYELEVSSAGLEHPLMNHRQYVKNIGRKIELTLTDGTEYDAKLVAVNELDFQIEYTLAKAKHKKEQKAIPFTAVKTAFIGVTF
jgi:ribosome maturation factor RimP